MKIEWVDVDDDQAAVLVGRDLVAQEVADVDGAGREKTIPEDVVGAVVVQGSDDNSGSAAYMPRAQAERIVGALAIELGWSVSKPDDDDKGIPTEGRLTP